MKNEYLVTWLQDKIYTESKVVASNSEALHLRIELKKIAGISKIQIHPPKADTKPPRKGKNLWLT